ILFERGLFDARSTQLVAGATQLMALGLLALLFLEVIARSFYALSDTLTPVLAGGIQVLMMAVLSIWMRDVLFAVRGWPPLGALALGFTISNYIEVGLLLWLLRRKLGHLSGALFFSGAWRMLIAAVLMAGVTWFLLSWIDDDADWLKLIAGGLAGAVVYFLACLFLRVSELQQILAAARSRLAR
ncbi:MAG: lipid II flippase MurJ, partial [Candidatus Promineifilaceae bacterium]